MMPVRARFPLLLAGTVAALVVLVAWIFTVGRFAVAPSDVLRALWASLFGGDSFVGSATAGMRGSLLVVP